MPAALNIYKMYEKTIFSLARWAPLDLAWRVGIMGVLPDMAHDVGISMPAATSIAGMRRFGVVIGAPIASAALQPDTVGDAAVLAGLCILGNALFATIGNYAMLAAGWFPGFPHGAFFGVGAIILSKIARR